MPEDPIVSAAREAARVLLKEHNLGDFVYQVRERLDLDSSFQGSTWDHPKVLSFGAAVNALEAFVAAGDLVLGSEDDPAPYRTPFGRLLTEEQHAEHSRALLEAFPASAAAEEPEQKRLCRFCGIRS